MIIKILFLDLISRWNKINLVVSIDTINRIDYGSSRSGQKYINTEEISENKRYNSCGSINDSPSVNDGEIEVNRELESNN